MDSDQAEPFISQPQQTNDDAAVKSPVVTFSNDVDEEEFEDSNLIQIQIIQSTCILDSTSPLSKLLMITPLMLIVSGLSLVTISEYGSYGDLDPNDDRVTIIGKSIFAAAAIFVSIVSVFLVTPDPMYLSGVLIIFSNISVPFSWTFSGLSLLGLVIIAVIYKTLRHNLKVYKMMTKPSKYE